ncbi:MAG TPA: MFS transporter [Actinomycetota bacterium]|nr:MFS transporter [Actinomycetota bacterium]
MGAPETVEPGIRDVLRIPEVRAAIVGTFVIMLGFGIVSPVLPSYARSFGVGEATVGLLISGFSFARLLAGPFVGRLIDRRGERAMVALGAAIVGATSIAAGLAPTFPALLVLRSLGGVGSALFFAALLSYLLRTIPPDRSGRVMSVWYGAFNVGIIAGGPLGGVIAEWLGLASPLHVYGVACFAAAGLFLRAIRDPARSAEETRAGGLRRLPWGRPFAAVLAANGAYLWLIGAVFSTLVPLFGADDVGLSLRGIGLAIAVVTAVELVVLYPAGKATDRRGRRAVLVPALAGLAAVTMVTGFATTPATFLLAMGAYGLTSGFAGVPPAPMLSDVTPEEIKGSAVAVFRFVGDIGFVLGPLVAGWTAEHLGYPTAFAVSAVPVLLALALVASVAETKRPLPRSGEAAGL